MVRKFTRDEVSQMFKDANCELLSKEYINSNTLLDFKCSCGNIS